VVVIEDGSSHHKTVLEVAVMEGVEVAIKIPAIIAVRAVTGVAVPSAGKIVATITTTTVPLVSVNAGGHSLRNPLNQPRTG